MLSTHECIISVPDLQNTPQVAIANAQKQPLVVTADGKPAAYLVGVDIFDALMGMVEQFETAQIKAGVAQGEAQFEQGQFKGLTEVQEFTDVYWKESA